MKGNLNCTVTADDDGLRVHTAHGDLTLTLVDVMEVLETMRTRLPGFSRRMRDDLELFEVVVGNKIRWATEPD